MFGADYFPELGSDLVAALAALDVEDFTHFLEREREIKANEGFAFSDLRWAEMLNVKGKMEGYMGEGKGQIF